MTRSASTGSAIALAVGAAAGAVDAHAQTVDISYFVQRGDVLLSSAWSSTFADPGLQAGAVQVGGLALIAKLALLPGVFESLALSVVVQAVMATLLAAVTGLVLAERSPRARLGAQLAVVATALATGMIHRAYTDGHPAQIVIPLLWVCSGLAARRGRPGAAGILIGLSAGFETWGMLGVPLLLLCPGARARMRGLGGAASLVALLYLPFVAAGQFRMFEYAWPVVDGSPASLVLEAGSPFGWWMRVAQGGAAIAAGGWVALRLRSSSAAVWAVPLVTVMTRLVFEPSLNDWYLIAVETLALVAAADLFTGQVSVLRAGARRARASAPTARGGSAGAGDGGQPGAAGLQRVSRAPGVVSDTAMPGPRTSVWRTTQ